MACVKGSGRSGKRNSYPTGISVQSHDNRQSPEVMYSIYPPDRPTKVTNSRQQASDDFSYGISKVPVERQSLSDEMKNSFVTSKNPNVQLISPSLVTPVRHFGADPTVGQHLMPYGMPAQFVTPLSPPLQTGFSHPVTSLLYPQVVASVSHQPDSTRLHVQRPTSCLSAGDQPNATQAEVSSQLRANAPVFIPSQKTIKNIQKRRSSTHFTVDNGVFKEAPTSHPELNTKSEMLAMPFSHNSNLTRSQKLEQLLMWISYNIQTVIAEQDH